MKKILILYDGSELSDRALEKGKELAKAFGSDVLILNIVSNPFLNAYIGKRPTPIVGADQLFQEIVKEAEEMLVKAKDSLKDLTGKVETLILEGDPANRIIDFIEAEDIDLVVIGYHGLGARINRFLMGSLTTKLLHHVKKPVLVVK